MDVEAEGGDWSDLLVNWLAELVFLFDTEQFVPTEVTIAQCEPPRCAGRLRGFPPGPGGRGRGVLIKAVTYHQLEVEVTPEHGSAGHT